MGRSIPSVLLVAALVTASIAGGALAGSTAAADEGAATGLAVGDGPETNRTAGNASAACDYVGLYEETIDSVVQVQVDASNATERRGGVGSGFVYERTNATHVVTNQHVVGERERVTIEFSDGQSRTGAVVGTDVYSDLAVVEVEEAPEGVESLAIADESPLPGTKVAALGSPFGLEGTITEGIVSAVDRSMSVQQGFSIPNAVQTDAPINPGNSGGPLVTCDGDVVGVNRAGGGQNIGFAIGTSLLERVVPSLVEDGEYDHPFLGVRTTEITPALAETNDLETTNGVYVHRTVTGGPAADALEGSTDVEAVDGRAVPVGGDVIVGIGGQEVRNGEELNGYLATETEPGDEVDLSVIRDGEETTVTVTVGERPEPGGA